MKTILTHSPEETERVGKELAEALLAHKKENAFIALFGEMGVGKTAFARGFATALGCTAVRSPTYTVVNEYLSGNLPVFHFDMYRIEDEDDLLSIGFDDYLSRKGYALCEWSENIEEDIPAEAIFVKIERIGEESSRKITIEGEDVLC